MWFVSADLSVLLGCLQAESWISWAELPSGQQILCAFPSLLQVFSELRCCVPVDEKNRQRLLTDAKRGQVLIYEKNASLCILSSPKGMQDLGSVF